MAGSRLRILKQHETLPGYFPAGFFMFGAAYRYRYRGMTVVLFLREKDQKIKDLAQPLNLFDPKSGVVYFQAVTALAKVYR